MEQLRRKEVQRGIRTVRGLKEEVKEQDVMQVLPVLPLRGGESEGGEDVMDEEV